MNVPKSWDPSLVKKFNSSNHYKLLNQLRTEVKKYPLNNKKKKSSIQSKDSNLDNKNNSNLSNTEKSLFSDNSSYSSESSTNKSNVSFNNSKNFSLYNQTTNNIINPKNESSFPYPLKSNDDSSSQSQSFKDRLNQVDMK